jgi:hypothetical protein
MSDVITADARDAEQAPALPPLVLGVAIAAAVFGLLGLGAGLLQLVLSVVGGGALAMGSGGAFMSGYMGMWATASLVVGVIIVIVGLLLSLLATVSGGLAAFSRRVSALKWVAAVLVLFDLLAHVLWPIISQIISMVLIFQEMGADAMGMAALGLISPVIVLLWSVLLIVFWIATFVVMSRHGRTAAVATA